MTPQLINHLFRFVILYGFENAVLLVNQVLRAHNDAVEQKPNRNMMYWLDTSNFSDEQCLLSSMLDKKLCYALIDPLCNICGAPESMFASVDEHIRAHWC